MAVRKRVSTGDTKKLLATETVEEHVASESAIPTLSVVPSKTRASAYKAITHIGGLPRPNKMPVADLLDMVRSPNVSDNVETAYRNRVKSPLTAIRAYCVLCAGGSPKAATQCSCITCPLWLFRTGRNPYSRRKP